MEVVKSWIVTFDPNKSIKFALGPNDPDSEQAILAFLTYDEAQKYVYDSGMMGASIVEVEISRPEPPRQIDSVALWMAS